MAVRNMAMDIASNVARQAFGFRSGCAHHGPPAPRRLRWFRDGIVVLDMASMRRTEMAGATA